MLLSLGEVSKKFGVERSTIYKAVSKGKLFRDENGKFKLDDIIEYFGEPKPISRHSSNPNDILLYKIIDKINLIEEKFKNSQENENFLLTKISNLEKLLQNNLKSTSNVHILYSKNNQIKISSSSSLIDITPVIYFI